MICRALTFPIVSVGSVQNGSQLVPSQTARLSAPLFPAFVNTPPA